MTARIVQDMQCIQIREFGGPEVLQLVSRKSPVPEKNEVLVRVKAAGVNRPDVFQRQGHYAPPKGSSDLPGLEVAGIIQQTGEDVHHLHVGDEVCALLAGGGYAEYCTVPAVQVLPIPKGLSMVEAAALPETFFTVWTNVFESGALKRGESILIHGGSSGIGTTAIQMAKHMGARVLVTAGSDEKCQACEHLGADHAINYHTEDFVQAVRKLTDYTGVDVILDMVGGDYLPRNLKALAYKGRHVSIAFLRGSVMKELDLMPLILKRQILTGSTLRAREPEEKGRIAQELKTHIWPAIESGKIKPRVFKTFPLAQAEEAHRLMESSQHIGKIVLTI
ncbi:NAD(P)H-quinone oxidoreductase [Microvirga sp. W0021]|uniref:NAD(P)H-quinone oxidoreductase n=1 Tax=Hohaiivirga grylli TaxID=3133970 RepID=A0ABV0BET3_9HYPH